MLESSARVHSQWTIVLQSGQQQQKAGVYWGTWYFAGNNFWFIVYISFNFYPFVIRHSGSISAYRGTLLGALTGMPHCCKANSPHNYSFCIRKWGLFKIWSIFLNGKNITKLLTILISVQIDHDISNLVVDRGTPWLCQRRKEKKNTKMENC